MYILFFFHLLIILLNINIKIQLIITSGYTMFLVTGLSTLLSHIALILCTEVTRETATVAQKNVPMFACF